MTVAKGNEPTRLLSDLNGSKNDLTETQLVQIPMKHKKTYIPDPWKVKKQIVIHRLWVKFHDGENMCTMTEENWQIIARELELYYPTDEWPDTNIIFKIESPMFRFMQTLCDGFDIGKNVIKMYDLTVS